VNIELSQRVQSIKPSPTLAVTARAAALKAAGHDIIGLGAGEPDFDTPQYIKDAAIAAMNKGLTSIPLLAGRLLSSRLLSTSLQAKINYNTRLSKFWFLVAVSIAFSTWLKLC